MSFPFFRSSTTNTNDATQGNSESRTPEDANLPAIPTVQTFEAAEFPSLKVEDILIGEGTIFATAFPGVRNGPLGHAWIFAKKACESIPVAWPPQYRDLTSGQYVTSSWVIKLECRSPAISSVANTSCFGPTGLWRGSRTSTRA